MDAGGVARDHVEAVTRSSINCLTYEQALQLAIAAVVIPTGIGVLSASGKFMPIPTENEFPNVYPNIISVLASHR
jgi:hypothetical protein